LLEPAPQRPRASSDEACEAREEDAARLFGGVELVV
jgi:hypothetical protein